MSRETSVMGEKGGTGNKNWDHCLTVRYTLSPDCPSLRE